jgi:proteasome accessory factor B
MAEPDHDGEYDPRRMHPLERLLNLVILLLETPRFLTFDQIRERLPAYDQADDESAKRMFERDKDVLRDLGVPVEVGATDAWDVDQGYRIPKDRYYLPDIEFTEEEISALFVAAQTPGAEGDAEQAVRKLQAGVEPSALARLAGGPVASGADVPAGRLRAVTEAIEGRHSLRFDYRAASGEVSGRHVDPYSLVWRAGHWYLVGLDRDRKEIRSFRLSRLRSDPEGAGEGSEPPEAFDGREHLRAGPWPPADEAVEARVAFSPDVAWWAVPSIAEARVMGTEDDGWVEVALPAERGEGFTSWALSFGPEAVVLGPADLREDVVRRLEAAAGER